MWVIILFVLISWILLVLAAWSYVNYRSQQQMVAERIARSIDLPRQYTPSRSWGESISKWFDTFASTGESIELLSDPPELEEYLIKAGYPYRVTVRRLQGAKVVGALIGLGWGVLNLLMKMPLAQFTLVFSPLAGYLAPIFGIRYLAKKRQEEIRYELPDFLDMMSITLQAGMGLDTALNYYSETTKGPLSEEINRMNQEILFGVQREVAYRSLIDRTDSPELETLIQSMIQAHNLGTPISQTFAQQADEMRKMRAEQAKEKAGKSEPKISAVGGLIIAPSIMLLIFGAFALKYFIAEDGSFQLFPSRG